MYIVGDPENDWDKDDIAKMQGYKNADDKECEQCQCQNPFSLENCFYCEIYKNKNDLSSDEFKELQKKAEKEAEEKRAPEKARTMYDKFLGDYRYYCPDDCFDCNGCKNRFEAVLDEKLRDLKKKLQEKARKRAIHKDIEETQMPLLGKYNRK
jgi:hypothetical protein